LYVDVNKINIVLVGDKKKILPRLQRLGYEIVELKQPEIWLNDNNYSNKKRAVSK